MNKYVLMLASAGLIAAAPAYYAFQAQAEEAPAATSEEAAKVDCANLPEGAEAPAECTDAAAPAAGEAAPFAEKATGGTTSIRTADSGIVRSESVFA